MANCLNCQKNKNYRQTRIPLVVISVSIHVYNYTQLQLQLLTPERGYVRWKLSLDLCGNYILVSGALSRFTMVSFTIGR